jgi:hypothetical protein
MKSTGAATESSEQIGKSREGNPTKIHLAVDSGGLPVCFDLSEEQRHDIVCAEILVSNAFTLYRGFASFSCPVKCAF